MLFFMQLTNFNNPGALITSNLPLLVTPLGCFFPLRRIYWLGHWGRPFSSCSVGCSLFTHLSAFPSPMIILLIISFVFLLVCLISLLGFVHDNLFHFINHYLHSLVPIPHLLAIVSSRGFFNVNLNYFFEISIL